MHGPLSQARWRGWPAGQLDIYIYIYIRKLRGIPDFLDFRVLLHFLFFLLGFWGPGGIPMDSQRNFDPP